MPIVKDPPPRRRLGKSNGDNIIALFEGSATREIGGGELHTSSSTPSKTKSSKDENEQLISSLFPTTNKNKNDDEQQHHQKQNQETQAGDDHDDSLDATVSAPPLPPPVPPPRTDKTSPIYSPLMTAAASSAANKSKPSAPSSSQQQQQQQQPLPPAPKKQQHSTEVQTTTGGAEFRIYELVVSASPNPHGIVTREHAAHRAMLERQLSQRIVDARIDERFNRQAIEEARDLALEAVASAYRFHAQALEDLLYLKDEQQKTNSATGPTTTTGDDDFSLGDNDDENENIDQQLITRMNYHLYGNNNKNGRNNNNKNKKVPRFVPTQKFLQLVEENAALTDRVDLLGRRLQAQSQGIPFLVNTVRFPPPPPSADVVEAEEGRVRRRLLDLEDELITNLVSIWGAPPAFLVRQHRLARQQQQQAISAMPLDQKLQVQVIDVEAKEREAIENEEEKQQQQQKPLHGGLSSSDFFTSTIRSLNQEKEKYRVRYELLVVEATEEAARKALAETVLDVRQSFFLETLYSETKIKAELTRKLRGSLQDQHKQMLRHKKENSKNLPPVAERVPPKNSTLKSIITPEARRAAALVLTEQKQMTTSNDINNNNNTARNLEGEMVVGVLPAIKQTPSALTPRPPQQQQQQQQSSSISKRTLGGFASSYVKSSLYNSGFSRPYENL
jgi:hypothetical protein